MDNGTKVQTATPTAPQPTPKKGSAAVNLLAILVVVLLFIAIVLGFFYIRNQREAEAIQQELLADKDSISHNLENVLFEYNGLQTENTQLQEQVALERERAEKLLEEIKNVKKVSYSKIKSYQRELGTLRAIMRNMVKEIDSLNTLNQNLIAENTRVRTEYAESQENVQRLSSQNEELNQAVEKGSRIQLRNIETRGLKKRDRTTKRARWTKKLRTCFTLMANSIAKPGPRPVFIQITAPDGSLLLASDSGPFPVGEETQQYSAKREVDYQNEDIDLCVFFDGAGAQFAKGIYHVDIFMAGEKLGETDCLLK